MIKNKKRIRDIRKARKQKEEEELKEIERRLKEECPPKGVCIINYNYYLFKINQ